MFGVDHFTYIHLLHKTCALSLCVFLLLLFAICYLDKTEIRECFMMECNATCVQKKGRVLLYFYLTFFTVYMHAYYC